MKPKISIEQSLQKAWNRACAQLDAGLVPEWFQASPSFPSKQTLANVRNSARSTGPHDPSRSAMNALKHGLTSQKLLLPDESEAAFEQFKAELLRRWAPRNGVEMELLEGYLRNKWRRLRLEKIQEPLLRSLLWNTDPNRDQQPMLLQLDLLRRYEVSLERPMFQCLELLIEIRKDDVFPDEGGIVIDAPSAPGPAEGEPAPGPLPHQGTGPGGNPPEPSPPGAPSVPAITSQEPNPAPGTSVAES